MFHAYIVPLADKFYQFLHLMYILNTHRLHIQNQNSTFQYQQKIGNPVITTLSALLGVKELTLLLSASLRPRKVEYRDLEEAL